MQSYVLSTLLYSGHVYNPKNHNLTWFDVTIRAQIFRKVVKLIFTGGKNEKNIDHCRWMGLLCLHLDQITDSHLANVFRIKTF